MPDPVPAELAPFLANAHMDLAAAIEGLPPEEVVRHLHSTVAHAEIEASRLGIRFDEPTPLDEPLTLAEGGPVVVIRRLVEPDDET